MSVRTHPHSALYAADHGAQARILEDIAEHGLVVFDDGLDRGLVNLTWKEVDKFFRQPPGYKRSFERPSDGHQRGYTPPRLEHARDQHPDAADLKEFWQEGPNSPKSAYLLPNVQTDNELFDMARQWMHRELSKRAVQVFSVLAPLLGVSPKWLIKYAGGGDDIVRFLRYFALRGHNFPSGTFRSAPHTDINLITLLKSRGPGLVVTTKSGARLALDIDPRQLVVQMGDMIEVLSGGLLPATVHWVENPDNLDSTRDSIALFTHPAPERWIDILPHLRRPDHTWDPRTERSYTEERLIEIGILKGPPKFDSERVSRGHAAPPSPWVDHI